MTTSLASGALALSLVAAGAQAAAPVAPQLRGAVPKFLVKPPSAYVQARLQAAMAQPGLQPASISTIPYWTATVTSPLDHRTYTYSMVGSSPFAPTPSNTNISYVPIVLRIHVKLGGTSYVIDPTQTSHCDTQSASTRFFNSPIFKPLTSFTSNGVQVVPAGGSQQLLSAYQRANYWSAVKSSKYGVTLNATRLSPIVVDWTPTRNGPRAQILNDDCGGTFAIAEVDINDLDTELQSIGRDLCAADADPGDPGRRYGHLSGLLRQLLYPRATTTPCRSDRPVCRSTRSAPTSPRPPFSGRTSPTPRCGRMKWASCSTTPSCNRSARFRAG